MKIQELRKEDLVNIDGGGFKEAAVQTLFTVCKYSSLSGALLTGVIAGYLSEKAKQN